MLGVPAFLLVLLWAFPEGSVGWSPYNNSIGGSRLRRIPKPCMVVITVTDQWSEFPQPDCVGVYVGGYGSTDVSFVITSPWCIATPIPDDPYWYPQEVRNAVNEITGSTPYTLEFPFKDGFHLGALQMSPPFGYYVPDVADMILNKREYMRHLDAGNVTYGFSFGVNTNPIKVLTVSWNQENCARRYADAKLPDWPPEMREGWFCVFRGRHKVHNVTIGSHVYDVDVGVPCDDAMGSPVMMDDLNKVLGIVIKTYCDGDKSVAFAMSPAYLPDIVPPLTTKTTASTITEPTSHQPSPPIPPPPPYPRIPEPIKTCYATRITGCLILWCVASLFGFCGI